MPKLTMRELAEMTGGEVVQNPDVVVSSVVIDSREVKPDSVFFAIKGERLDGHQFIPQALQTALKGMGHHRLHVVQEQRSVLHKQLGILKLRPVIGVGVDD